METIALSSKPLIEVNQNGNIFFHGEPRGHISTVDSPVIKEAWRKWLLDGKESLVAKDPAPVVGRMAGARSAYEVFDRRQKAARA